MAVGLARTAALAIRKEFMMAAGVVTMQLLEFEVGCEFSQSLADCREAAARRLSARYPFMDLQYRKCHLQMGLKLPR
jgi:hypothetical protein